MNNTVLTIIAAGLFIAWLFSPIVILRYIRVDVQRRWKEIEDWFCAIQETDMLPKLYQKKSGAWFYARFLKPDANPTDPKQILKTQFLQFHDPWHYALPLLLVFVLSGLMLAFTGLWLADALSSKGTSPTGTNVQLKTS